MMLEGEAEPTAPEGAPVSPSAESASVESVPNAGVDEEASSPAEASSAVEDAAPPAEAPADWSHVQGFQSIEAASEGRSLGSDYEAELGKELGVRAARFALSVDESIVLSSEGLMRWLGDPVARVVAGDELLRPRAVLLADDALTGEDRAGVENRAALWLAAHVRKVLGPLLALGEGTDMPDAARGLGAAIVEALGVLERDRVREGVRALDQTARGALRKLGVRFGSLYIYVPILLKPGPRGLCTLLWTLKRGSETGADRLLGFASAGRTSFANEGLLSPDAYRVAGFRLCGERVVRVDIIERLSDLIRAAIPDHLRSGSRAATPAYGFPVTPQMTSLTGCSGEAFASILRSLGFESVRIGKAAFDAARATAPTAPLTPTLADGGERKDVEAEPAPGAEETEAVSEPRSLEAESAFVAVEPETSQGSEPEAAPEALAEAESAPLVMEAEASVEPSSEEHAVASGEGSAAEGSAAEGSAAEGLAPTVDEEIEIWRPAPRRPRVAKPAHSGDREAGRRGKPRRHEPAAEAPAEAVEARAPHGPRRGPHPERRDEGPRREAKEENRDDRRPQNSFGPRREPRPVQIDPDSPFAKLAALKPLLERRDKRP